MELVFAALVVGSLVAVGPLVALIAWTAGRRGGAIPARPRRLLHDTRGAPIDDLHAVVLVIGGRRLIRIDGVSDALSFHPRRDGAKRTDTRTGDPRLDRHLVFDGHPAAVAGLGEATRELFARLLPAVETVRCDGGRLTARLRQAGGSQIVVDVARAFVRDLSDSQALLSNVYGAEADVAAAAVRAIVTSSRGLVPEVIEHARTHSSDRVRLVAAVELKEVDLVAEAAAGPDVRLDDLRWALGLRRLDTRAAVAVSVAVLTRFQHELVLCATRRRELEVLCAATDVLAAEGHREAAPRIGEILAALIAGFGHPGSNYLLRAWPKVLPRALGQLGDADGSVEEPLLALLRHPHERLRGRGAIPALRALRHVGTVRCVPELRQISRGLLGSRDLRWAAQGTIAAIQARADASAGALAVVAAGPGGELAVAAAPDGASWSPTPAPDSRRLS